MRTVDVKLSRSTGRRDDPVGEGIKVLADSSDQDGVTSCESRGLLLC